MSFSSTTRGNNTIKYNLCPCQLTNFTFFNYLQTKTLPCGFLIQLCGVQCVDFKLSFHVYQKWFKRGTFWTSTKLTFLLKWLLEIKTFTIVSWDDITLTVLCLEEQEGFHTVNKSTAPLGWPSHTIALSPDTVQYNQSIFSGIRPILVCMLRRKKKLTVIRPQATSATQKAMSQLWCLAMVLNGSPARKAPTMINRVASVTECHANAKVHPVCALDM